MVVVASRSRRLWLWLWLARGRYTRTPPALYILDHGAERAGKAFRRTKHRIGTNAALTTNVMTDACPKGKKPGLGKSG